MPKECELLVREQAVYKSCYCGLCKCIRRHYGFLSSCFLTYDCTFLALLLDAMHNGSVSSTPCKCLHACCTEKRRYREETPALAFSAAVNTVLSYIKTRDDIMDEGRLKSRIACAILKRPALKVEKQYPGLLHSAEVYWHDQIRVEQAKAGPDEAADPTGIFLRGLPKLYGCIAEKELPALEWLLYHLGRWIYFADALSDLSEDRKSGSFNVFLDPGIDPAFCLNASLGECRKALDVLTLYRDKGILDNITGLGCTQKTIELLQAFSSSGKESSHEPI